MEDNSVFNRLISDLTQSERLDMISKMHHIAPINDLPLNEKVPEEEYDYEKSYHNFSFFEKIIIFFTVLFSSREREKVIESLSMDNLSRQLERSSPDLINYNKKIFLNKFLLEIEKLQDSLTIFRDTLSLIMRSGESEFIAFLVGLHFPEIEAKLLNEIDPQKISDNMDFDNSFQLKRHIEFRIDEILAEIDADKKKIIYREIKNLHVLNLLSVFNFDKIISAFTTVDGEVSATCGFIDIRKSLHQLLDILFSLNVSPSADTLDAVFMFGYELLNSDNDLEKILQINLEEANITLDTIRKFNSKIPLESILCLLNRNMNFHPAHIGGAEDWYALFRRFWYKKFDKMMEIYTEGEKRHQLEEDAGFFLNISTKPVLSNYKKGLWGKELHIKYEVSTGFINAFMSGVFIRELIKPLKLVLIDGQFYKEQNRMDYNKSYRTITDTVDILKNLDDSLAVRGMYYELVKKIEEKESSKDSIAEQVEEVLASVDKEFEKIIVSFNAALRLLIDVISGIVQGEMGGIYDTLSNLGYIGKGENKNLTSQLNEIRFRLDEARNISHQLYDLEKDLG